MNKLTDNQLIKKTLYEDKEFFGFLIERYEKKMKRYIRRMTSFSNNDVDDLMQDIFIKIYQNLNDYDQKLSFSSWLYRIAHNLIIDDYRKKTSRKRDFKIDIDDNFFENIQNDTKIEKTTENNFHRVYIEKALSEIGGKYRDVIILYYFEEKNYREISDILKKTENTVATLLSRAKKQLRIKINDLTNKNYEQ